MDVVLHKARGEDLPVVKNLVPYYIYDMSEHMGWPCTREGRFDGCDGIERYWEDEGKHAFMLRCGDEPAGFTMVRGDHNKDQQIDYSIAEFFVVRKFRGDGVGERIARELFDRFRGRWLVEYLAKNKPAAAFWRKVIGRYCGGEFQQKTRWSEWGMMHVLVFESRG